MIQMRILILIFFKFLIVYNIKLGKIATLDLTTQFVYETKNLSDYCDFLLL